MHESQVGILLESLDSLSVVGLEGVNHTPETRNPKPETRNPKPEILNPKPSNFIPKP